MLVCHCTSKTDRDIHAMASDGARDASDVERRCDAGGVCGGCRPAIDCLLRAVLRKAGKTTRRTERAAG